MGTETKEINQSRSDDELKEAIQVVEKEIIKTDFQNPTLFLQLPTIREGLKELLSIRECIKSIDKDVLVTNK